MANLYEVKITGKDTKRFLKNLHRQKIQLYKIDYLDQAVIVFVDRSGYHQILKIKTIYKIEVVGYHGIFRLEYYLRKYFILIVSMTISILFIWFLSHLIFDVKIIHVKEEFRILIKEELKKEGIERYHFRKSFYEQEQIVKRIIDRNREKIEWLEIERVGTKYIAKVEERKYSKTQEDNTPRDIIAKKDGRILEIEASSGTVLVQKDQYVKKGDVLVSGQIKNKDILMDKVKAEGKVYASTWYTTKVELPYYYLEEQLTSNKKKSLTIEFFGHRFNLFDSKAYKNKKITPIFQVENKLLPFSLSLNEEQEIKKTEKLYTKDLILLDASSLAREKLLKQLGPDTKIIFEKSLKISEENSKIDIEIFFQVKEDITAYQEIPEEVKEES